MERLFLANPVKYLQINVTLWWHNTSKNIKRIATSVESKAKSLLFDKSVILQYTVCCQIAQPYSDLKAA